MANSYIAWNGPFPTTAAIAPVTTGTAIKTLLQIATPSTREAIIIGWGISFDGTTATNTPGKCELIQTDVAATVTAHTSSTVGSYNDGSAPATLMTMGTTATGYTATAEGTITATRLLDMQLVNPTTGYNVFFPLGREPMIPVSKFVRVRVTFGTAVNAVCYIIWEE